MFLPGSLEIELTSSLHRLESGVTALQLRLLVMLPQQSFPIWLQFESFVYWRSTHLPFPNTEWHSPHGRIYFSWSPAWSWMLQYCSYFAVLCTGMESRKGVPTIVYTTPFFWDNKMSISILQDSGGDTDTCHTRAVGNVQYVLGDAEICQQCPT